MATTRRAYSEENIALLQPVHILDDDEQEQIIIELQESASFHEKLFRVNTHHTHFYSTDSSPTSLQNLFTASATLLSVVTF
jgi:hypothetical protein